MVTTNDSGLNKALAKQLLTSGVEETSSTCSNGIVGQFV